MLETNVVTNGGTQHAPAPMGGLMRRMRKAPKSGIQSETIDLTPKRAKELLKSNFDNRSLSKTRIESYADDILNGRWDFNGETIIMSDTGEMNDGQHRCHAVILAGKSIPTILVTGVPRSSRFTTDQGYARTTGHFLSMNGVKNYNVVSRVAKIILQIEKSDNGEVSETTRHGLSGSSPMKATKQEILDYANNRLDEIRQALDAVNHKGARRLRSVAIIVAVRVFLARHANPAAVDVFLDKMCSGANLSGPMLKSRERLLDEKIAGTATTHKCFELLIRAWNTHRAGKRTKVVVRGYWPEIRA